MAQRENGATQAFGRMLVRGMPKMLALLSTVGTAAMLWVGGQIILHGLHVYPAKVIRLSEGVLGWIVEATLCGLFGLALGAAIVWVHHKIMHRKAH